MTPQYPMQDKQVRKLFARVNKMRLEFEQQVQDMECPAEGEVEADYYESGCVDEDVEEDEAAPTEEDVPVPEPAPVTPNTSQKKFGKYRSQASLATDSEHMEAKSASPGSGVFTTPADMTAEQKAELASLVLQMQAIEIECLGQPVE